MLLYKISSIFALIASSLMKNISKRYLKRIIKQVQAFWSRYFPVYHEIKKVLKSGDLGEIRLVQANLGFPIIVSSFTIITVKQWYAFLIGIRYLNKETFYHALPQGPLNSIMRQLNTTSLLVAPDAEWRVWATVMATNLLSALWI